MSRFDVVVLGGGPGGYVAAIRAAQLGLTVTVVEEQHLGGICLNWGCIPTKALLRSAEVMSMIEHAKDYGVQVGQPKLQLETVVQRSRAVSEKLAQGVQHLLKKNKIPVLMGRGRLAGKEEGYHRLEVATKNGSQVVLAKNVILATGAKARMLPMFEGKTRVWTYREAMVPKQLPKKLLVIGSGAIGVEFASFYQALGVQVTVVEMQSRMLPIEDAEISAFFQKQFEKRGIHVKTGAQVTDCLETKTGIAVTIKTADGSESETFDQLILAIGIEGRVTDLGLEQTKVQIDRSHIVVNEVCQTHEPGIYAIGDVVTGPWLAHKASHEGVMVAEKIAGQAVHGINRQMIPGCVYSTPQVASIGLTEEKALAQNLPIRIGRFPFMANGKALSLGEPDGLMKVLFHKDTGQLLGAHLIGTEVTEMIQGFAIAMTGELTEAELMHTIFPHPTLSEMMHEVVLNAYGRAIHI